MNRAVLGVVSGLLSLFGFMPTPPGWLRRLPHLHGTYRRSTFDRAFTVLMSVMVMCIAAFDSGLLIHEFRNRHDPATMGILGFAAPVLGTLGVMLYRRSGLHYKFDGGTLLALSGSERTLWAEPLVGLMTILCTSYRGTMSMLLIWPDRKRRVEVFDSLYAALNADT
jgi:hypothetical protein